MHLSSVMPMDWRAMSRSRSRMSMDWRPASRSRSRPPQMHEASNPGYSVPYDPRFILPHKPPLHPSSHDQVSFPTGPSTLTPTTYANSSLLSNGRRSPPFPRTELPSVYESGLDQRYDHADPSLMPLGYFHQSSEFNSPTFAPSSLPSYGIHSPVLRAAPNNDMPPPDRRSFPRRVRKTSFDHTLYKDGILADIVGRHQVNGRPQETLGTKRRIETPHSASLLRADPSAVAGQASIPQPNRQSEALDGPQLFPSTEFNFAYNPQEGLFDLLTEQPANSYGLHPSLNPLLSEHPPNLYPSHSSGEGLSAAAAAASAALAEGYARMDATNLSGGDSSTFDYRHLLGLMYPGFENAPPQQSYTHVDPTHILSSPVDSDGNYPRSFHASPASDWTNGLSASSTASPEPFHPSNASTPPSIDGTFSVANALQARKYVPLKQSAQDELAKKSSPAGDSKGSSVESKAGPSDSKHDSPDVHDASGKAGGDEAETPTVCTNCQTTNTPLWRRDPEGHPLCALSSRFCLMPSMMLTSSINLGNACGLFYVSSLVHQWESKN